MGCHKENKYIDYLDGLLKPGEQASFKTHISTCADCQKALRELELTLGYVKRVSVELPPEDYWPRFYQGLRQKIGKAREQKSLPAYKLWDWHWWWAPKPALAAVLSLLVVSLIIFKMVFSPSPPDITPDRAHVTISDLETLWNQRSAEEELRAVPKEYYEQIAVKLLQMAEVRDEVPAPPPAAIAPDDLEDPIAPTNLEDEIDRLNLQERIWLEKRLKELA